MLLVSHCSTFSRHGDYTPNEGQQDRVDLMNETFLSLYVVREGLHVLHEIPVLPHFKISVDASFLLFVIMPLYYNVT